LAKARKRTSRTLPRTEVMPVSPTGPLAEQVGRALAAADRHVSSDVSSPGPARAVARTAVGNGVQAVRKWRRAARDGGTGRGRPGSGQVVGAAVASTVVGGAVGGGSVVAGA